MTSTACNPFYKMVALDVHSWWLDVWLYFSCCCNWCETSNTYVSITRLLWCFTAVWHV